MVSGIRFVCEGALARDLGYDRVSTSLDSISQEAALAA